MKNKITLKRKRYYFSHYGEVYSTTREQALAVAQQGASGNGWTFDGCKELNARSNRDRPKIIGGRFGTEVMHVLDWSSLDWKEFIEREMEKGA